jgi:predicted membrane protein
MTEIIALKNKPNWIIALTFPFGLLILILIMLVLLPIVSVNNTYLLSALSYVFSLIPFLGFFILFLYIWLWNTFGKVILEISPEKIKATNKNKLFNKPKEYLKSEIEKISIVDFGIEKTKYYIQLNYLFSNSNYSITIQKGRENIRIVDWLSNERANNILEKINQ